MLHNLTLVYKDKISLARGILALFFMITLQYWQLEFKFVAGNLGLTFARAEVILFALIAILFAVFVALQAYKIRQFRTIKQKKSIGGWFGGMLGVLTVGCPACSITIASFLGLSSLIIALPFKGLEIKVLAIILLIRVDHTMIKDLLVCKKK